MALQTANNAICTLQNPILEDSTVIFLAWNYDRLPTSNFIVEIATFWADNETVTARENILIASRSWNQLIVWQRACEPVPIDDNASENIQQPLAFDIWWTVVKQVVSKALFDEIETTITTIIQNIISITNNYVSKTQLNQEKWTTIATLTNWKIPASQIDWWSLDVNSLVSEFTAWAAITAWDCVWVYMWSLTNNTAKQVNVYSSWWNTVSSNITFGTDDVYLASIDISLVWDYIGSYSSLTIKCDWFIIFGEAYATINWTLTVNAPINKFIKKWTRTAEVRWIWWRNYTYDITFNTQKPNNRTNKICRMTATSTSYQRKKFVWIALNSWSSWSIIRVKTFWIADVTWVDNWVSYTTNKWVLFPWVWVWVWVAPNKLLVNPTNRICFVKTYLSNSWGSAYATVDIYHTIASIPSMILVYYNNTLTEVTPNIVNDSYFNYTIQWNWLYSFIIFW